MQPISKAVWQPSVNCFQRRFAAMPPSMLASDDPMVDVPTESAADGAFHTFASMCAQRISISAACYAQHESSSVCF
jgi:hypothetical protein